MTQVITRYFETAAQARAAQFELVNRKRVPQSIITLHTAPTGLADTLSGAGVAAETAKAYETRLAKGGAVLLVRAGYKPLGVAQITRDVAAQAGAVVLDGFEEEAYIRDKRFTTQSVLKDHPHFLTRAKDPNRTTFHMADWPLPLIIRRAPYRDALFEPHARMADAILPLINRRKPYTGSIFAPHARMANFPLPLLSRRKPFTGSIFSRHARMANFPIPLLSNRKPYTGSILARHARMANWPFPHLINGKTGTNSLMPGAPRMANFPIPLLSDRKPYDASAIPRHGRMANFPLPLISRRKPYNGSAFPRHARMADAILPLIVRRGDTASRDGGSGFSLSKMLGLPTLIRR